MADLPAAVQAFERVGMSGSCWTVPDSTATFLPHRVSGVSFSGLPFFTIRLVPALK